MIGDAIVADMQRRNLESLDRLPRAELPDGPARDELAAIIRGERRAAGYVGADCYCALPIAGVPDRWYVDLACHDGGEGPAYFCRTVPTEWRKACERGAGLVFDGGQSIYVAGEAAR